MAGSLQNSGGQPQKPPRYTPLYTSRFFSGLNTNRSPLRSAGSAYEERYLGNRGDSLIDGSNCEISPRLTLIRRPGNPVYNSQTFGSVDFFYSFREFSINTEQIRVMVDETTALYDGTANSRTLVFTKSTGAGQSYMQSVGNTLFFANGIDQKKWVETLLTRTSSAAILPNIGNNVTLNPVSTPYLSSFVIDSNNNLQQFLAASVQPISNVAFDGTTLTLTVPAVVGITPGSEYLMWNVGTATWLNGITILVATAAGTTVTATLVNASHAVYGSAGDTGNITSVGGTAITGGSVPTWSATVPNSGNNYQGGFTVDGTVIWLNKGNPVENWGLVAGSSSPTVVVGTSGSAWKTNTYFSLPGVIIDSNGNLQKVTTAGISGPSQPTWATVVSNTTNDGTVVWTMIQSAASLTWAAHTHYANGAFLVANASGTNCLFQLQSPPSTPTLNIASTINIASWSVPSGSQGGQFIKLYPATGPDGTDTNNALMFNVTDDSSQPLVKFVLNGAGETTSSSFVNAPSSTHYNMAFSGTFTVPVAGQYSLAVSHYNGFIFGIGNATGGGIPSLVSGIVSLIPGQTGTGVHNYNSVLAGNNNRGPGGGFITTDNFVVNFPTADTYPFEFDYSQIDTFQQFIVKGNNNIIAPSPSISGATQPIWPAWSTGFAPNYPNVKEAAGQYQWNNLGPAVDFTWQKNTTFTLPNSTITDANNNTEAPYRTGVSGAVAPTFSTGLNQLTLDNPNLIWINKGPASAPAPGTISALAGGYQYTVALVNTATDTVSNGSPLSPTTGDFFGAAGVTITGGLPSLASIDPQADYVAIFRTTDGQTTPFLIPGTGNSLYTVPLSQYLQDGYLDTANDTELNNEIQAPIAGENTPPANGAKNLTYHLSRIFFSVGNTVYWTSGPDSPVGNGVEGVAPANTQVFPSLVTRIVPTTVGAFIFTVSDIYVIVGQGTASNPIQPAYPYLQGIGLLNFNALDINGAEMGFYSSDKRFIILDPASGPSDVGFNIGNLLAGSSWSPTAVYVTYHASGEDAAWFLSDGSTGWYRVSPTPAPEQGVTWSPFATIVGGVKAVQSIETSPGVHKLLSGPVTSGPILNRDITVWQDNGNNYSWFATVGSHVLANPGQLAEVAFITLDSVATGSKLSLSVVTDECVPYYTGPFYPLLESVEDPPTLPPSVSTYAQRFYLAQTDEPAVCRHLQYRIDASAENFQNEVMTCTIFGALLIEI